MTDLVLISTTTLGPNNTTTTTEFTPILPDIDKCNYYIVKNQTEFLKFGNPYGGIPQNLLINVIGWLILVLMFAILRRAAGNYGRLALIRKDDDESRWTQIFYSQQDDEVGDYLKICSINETETADCAKLDQ